MASKNDVARSEAVRVRKVLAPGVGSKQKADSRKLDSQDVTQLTAATRAKIAELKRQAQHNGSFPSRSAAAALANTSTVTADSKPNRTNGKSIRNLRATPGVNMAAFGNAVPVKSRPASQSPVKSPNKRSPQNTQQPQLKSTQKRTSLKTPSADSNKTLLAKQSVRQVQLKAPTQSNPRPQVNQVARTGTQHSVQHQAKSQPATAKPSQGGKTTKQLVPVTAKQEKTPEQAPKPKQERKPAIINATALLAAKYPNYFADNNDNRTKAETRTVLVVASLILTIIAFGWINWTAINFQSGGDFTYNSGLIGGITMLVVLIYALRKRLKILRRAGNMEAWYYFHLLGGVLGPFVIIFHTGYTIKSINSGVALFTMITIVLSGVFGRYIYPRIGYSLHRKLLEIKDSETHLMDVLHSYESAISDRIERRLSNFALSILTGQSSILKLPMRLLAIRGAATSCYVKVSTDVTAMVKSRAKLHGYSDMEVKARINREKDQLREHIGALANIANAHLFERILVKWRILHIPLLYILVITSLFHVLAVHMY